jgi:hypothetical protein
LRAEGPVCAPPLYFPELIAQLAAMNDVDRILIELEQWWLAPFPFLAGTFSFSRPYPRQTFGMTENRTRQSLWQQP